jgi:hypothetical protein
MAEPATALMKSRRRIAFPEAQLRDLASQLQQGFTPGGMGFRGQFAPHQSRASHVRFGSKADIGPYPRDVRFTSKSGH